MAERRSMLVEAGRQLVQAVSSSSWASSLLAPNGAYQGASSLRQALRAWTTTRGSADVDTIPNLDTLRSRSRDLVRNVPTASAALNKKTLNVVATGLKFKSRLDAGALGLTEEAARKKEQEIGEVFHRWAKAKESDAARLNNFYQIQALVYRSMLESGDVFALLPYITRPGAYLDLAVKLVESDLCRDPDLQMPTRKLAGGIEIDQWGAPVAYWFSQSHAQDLELQAAETMTRIPAYGELTGRPMVLHVFGQLRPGQRRGVPFLSPVIEPLKNLGRYKDAELMAAVVGGMFSVFITSSAGVPGPGNVAPGAAVGSGPNPITRDPGDYEMTYGGIVDLQPGETIQTANPGRPNPNFDPFTFAILKEVGGALGIGAEMIQGFYSSSYTAARAAFLDAWRGFRVDAENLTADFCDPVKNQVILNEVLRSALDLPGYLDSPLIRDLWENGEWVALAPGQIDAVKETQAYALQVKEGFTSRRMAAQELTGQDYTQIVADLAAEKKLRELSGLEEPNAETPRATPPASAPATTEDTEEDAEEDAEERTEDERETGGTGNE